MTSIEKLIANEIVLHSGAGLMKPGLRFDKVVLRLLGNIRTAIEQEVPNGSTVIITITAPIKRPAKTEDELIGKIRDFLQSGNQNGDILLSVFQNKIQIRIVKSSLKRPVKLVGLVHNADIDSILLLDLTTAWLGKP